MNLHVFPLTIVLYYFHNILYCIISYFIVLMNMMPYINNLNDKLTNNYKLCDRAIMKR